MGSRDELESRGGHTFTYRSGNPGKFHAFYKYYHYSWTQGPELKNVFARCRASLTESHGTAPTGGGISALAE
eukprot:3381469-Rhodomonas_salina.1